MALTNSEISKRLPDAATLARDAFWHLDAPVELGDALLGALLLGLLQGALGLLLAELPRREAEAVPEGAAEMRGIGKAGVLRPSLDFPNVALALGRFTENKSAGDI